MTDAPSSTPPRLHPDAVRAIVFDLDGTLVDSYGPIVRSLNHARAHYDLPPLEDSVVRRGVGKGLEMLIAELVGADRVAHGVALFRERYGQVFAEETFALPGVPETLRALHRSGYRLAVGSNKPTRFIAPILERLGLRELVHWVQGPEAGVPAKPEPAILHACLERIGASSRESVYVGDMVLDVESAARAGVPIVLVPGGSSPTADLRRTGERVLESFGELAELLGPAAGAD